MFDPNDKKAYVATFVTSVALTVLFTLGTASSAAPAAQRTIKSHPATAPSLIPPTIIFHPIESTTTTTKTVVSLAPVTRPPVTQAPIPGDMAVVSTYGAESGSTTANGEHFDGSSLTFANKTMAFGTMVQFCFRGNCVVARCNDRGPYVRGRTFDLSTATANAIGVSGVQTVEWHVQ